MSLLGSATVCHAPHNASRQHYCAPCLLECVSARQRYCVPCLAQCVSLALRRRTATARLLTGILRPQLFARLTEANCRVSCKPDWSLGLIGGSSSVLPIIATVNWNNGGTNKLLRAHALMMPSQRGCPQHKVTHVPVYTGRLYAHHMVTHVRAYTEVTHVHGLSYLDKHTAARRALLNKTTVLFSCRACTTSCGM